MSQYEINVGAMTGFEFTSSAQSKFNIHCVTKTRYEIVTGSAHIYFSPKALSIKINDRSAADDIESATLSIFSDDCISGREVSVLVRMPLNAVRKLKETFPDLLNHIAALD